MWALWFLSLVKRKVHFILPAGDKCWKGSQDMACAVRWDFACFAKCSCIYMCVRGVCAAPGYCLDFIENYIWNSKCWTQLSDECNIRPCQNTLRFIQCVLFSFICLNIETGWLWSMELLTQTVHYLITKIDLLIIHYKYFLVSMWGKKYSS